MYLVKVDNWDWFHYYLTEILGVLSKPFLSFPAKNFEFWFIMGLLS